MSLLLLLLLVLVLGRRRRGMRQSRRERLAPAFLLIYVITLINYLYEHSSSMVAGSTLSQMQIYISNRSVYRLVPAISE
jgi:hypothetical protein